MTFILGTCVDNRVLPSALPVLLELLLDPLTDLLLRRVPRAPTDTPMTHAVRLYSQETYTGFLNWPPRVVVGGIPEYGSLPMLRACSTILAGVWLPRYCLETARAPRRNREAMSEMRFDIRSIRGEIRGFIQMVNTKKRIFCVLKVTVSTRPF